MTEKTLLYLNGLNFRCLFLTENIIYIGTSVLGSIVNPGPCGKLILLNQLTSELIRSIDTRFLISNITIFDGKVYAGMGPGTLSIWHDLSCKNLPKVTKIASSAPRFAFDDHELWWATYRGEIRNFRNIKIAGVKKNLLSFAVGPTYLYGGYDDQKCRAFPRSGGRAKILKTGVGSPKLASHTNYLLTSDRKGHICMWDHNSLNKLDEFDVDVGNAQYGVIGLRVFGDLIAIHTYERLLLVDLSGIVLLQWEGKKGASIYDCWLRENNVLAACGPELVSIKVE